jgi:hypothetical protein
MVDESFMIEQFCLRIPLLIILINEYALFLTGNFMYFIFILDNPQTTYLIGHLIGVPIFFVIIGNEDVLHLSLTILDDHHTLSLAGAAFPHLFQEYLLGLIIVHATLLLMDALDVPFEFDPV